MAPSGAAVAAPIAASAHDAENCYTLCHWATHCDTKAGAALRMATGPGRALSVGVAGPRYRESDTMAFLADCDSTVQWRGETEMAWRGAVR